MMMNGDDDEFDYTKLTLLTYKKKLTFYLPFKLRTRNLLLVSRVLAKMYVIQAYYRN